MVWRWVRPHPRKRVRDALREVVLNRLVVVARLGENPEDDRRDPAHALLPLALGVVRRADQEDGYLKRSAGVWRGGGGGAGADRTLR